MSVIIVGNHHPMEGQAAENLFRGNEEAMVIVLRAAEPEPAASKVFLGRPERTHPTSPTAGRHRRR